MSIYDDAHVVRLNLLKAALAPDDRGSMVAQVAIMRASDFATFATATWMIASELADVFIERHGSKVAALEAVSGALADRILIVTENQEY